MNKNKDRNIRIENINTNDVLFTFYSNRIGRFFIILGIIFSLMLMQIDLYLAIISIFIFTFYILSIKKVKQISIKSDSIIYYIDDHYATIVYFDEIINYSLIKKDDHFLLNLLLSDNSEYDFLFNDYSMVKELDKLVGDKHVDR